MNRETIINRPLDIFRKAMLFLLLCVLIASCSKEDTITEETGITGTPHFTWDIAIELEQPNNWCMTLATKSSNNQSNRRKTIYTHLERRTFNWAENRRGIKNGYTRGTNKEYGFGSAENKRIRK